MTLAAQNTWTVEDANGVKTSFAIGFKVYDTSAIEVRLIDAAGLETLQAAGVDYMVTGSAGAYQVNFDGLAGAPAEGLQVAIRPTLAASQGAAFDDFSKFPAAMAEDALDRLAHLAKGAQDRLSRALRGPADEGEQVTPSIEARKGKFFKWDPMTGDPIADDARGPRGFVGPVGPIGPQGVQGPQGQVGEQGPAGVQAAFNFSGVVADAANLPVSASNGDAWLTTDDSFVHIWYDGQFYEVFEYAGGISGATVGKTIYVADNGNDSNDGRALNRPKASITSAVAALAALGAPACVYVYPGVYEEAGEIEIPEGCGVVSAAGQFVTEVHASTGNEQANMFLVNSGSYVQGFTFRGQQVDGLDNPTGGFAVAFAPGATIRRSPYVRDIGQVSQANYNTVFAPLDPANGNPLVGNGGGVLLADRAVLNANSTYPYMLAFGATPRSPNGIGYVAKNGAGINGISSISIFQRTAFYALNGGQITLNNSGTQFGDISMRAKGHTLVVSAAAAAPADLTLSVPDANAIDAVSGETGALVNQLWVDLVAEYGAKSAAYEAFTRRDANNLLRSISNDLRSGGDTVTRAFVKGLFDYKADYVFDAGLLPEFIWTFDQIETLIRGYVLAGAARTAVSALIDVVKSTLNSPDKRKFVSLIESLGHQFNNAGAGVNALALPANFRKPGKNKPVPFSILEEASATGEPRGRVRWSGADEQNNQYFAGGLQINGRTGRLEGRPFTASVRQLARRAVNSRGVI